MAQSNKGGYEESTIMKRTALYAALDLHSSQSVLGSMDHEGNSQGQVRFATGAESLREQVQALRKSTRALHLTLEAGALSRWAASIIRPLVDRLIICGAPPQSADQLQPQQVR
jgi:hypothetical protein